MSFLLARYVGNALGVHLLVLMIEFLFDTYDRISPNQTAQHQSLIPVWHESGPFHERTSNLQEDYLSNNVVISNRQKEKRSRRPSRSPEITRVLQPKSWERTIQIGTYGTTAEERPGDAASPNEAVPGQSPIP